MKDWKTRLLRAHNLLYQSPSIERRFLERFHGQCKCASVQGVYGQNTISTGYILTGQFKRAQRPLLLNRKTLNGLINRHYATSIISSPVFHLTSLSLLPLSEPVGRIVPRRPISRFSKSILARPPCVFYFLPSGSWILARLGASLSRTGASNDRGEDSRGNTWCFQREATFKWVYIYICIYFSLSFSLGEITRPSFVHIASWKTRLRRQNGACTVCPPVNWITWRKLRCKRRPNNF